MSNCIKWMAPLQHHIKSLNQNPEPTATCKRFVHWTIFCNTFLGFVLGGWTQQSDKICLVEMFSIIFLYVPVLISRTVVSLELFYIESNPHVCVLKQENVIKWMSLICMNKCLENKRVLLVVLTITNVSKVKR